jgi:hypothetical protein
VKIEAVGGLGPFLQATAFRMSHLGQTFDRAYLQNLAGLRRRQQIEQWINHSLHHHIEAAAADGKTSYLVNGMPQLRHMGTAGSPPIPYTSEELVEVLQKKYPGCDITYKEEWVDANSSTRVLQKGIVIDWS